MEARGSSTEYINADPNGLNSASDADINIALAYVYADKATRVYGWSNPSTTYLTMALNYIEAIRKNDFSTSDSNTANNHVLADGYKQALNTFSAEKWHPDYSDLRAYQLFITYDTNHVGFWLDAIDATRNCWKAIFNFGTNDKRTSENANIGPISPKTSWVRISNPTYRGLQANSKDYSSVTATRTAQDIDPQYYSSDSQRLPIRIMNYVNATLNGSDVDMLGIANSNLTALGTSYTNASYKCLVDRVSIANPWNQKQSDPPNCYVQNFTGGGLFAYASDSKLLYSNRATVYNKLNAQFGSNGTNGSIGMNISSTDDDGFNASLTLWALTVSKDGETLLQRLLGL